MTDNIQFTMRDISAETYGKYQFCTMAADGLWYADCDMLGSFPKRGALPAPQQDDPEKQARADLIIAAHAKKITDRALRASRPGLFARIMRALAGPKAEHDAS